MNIIINSASSLTSFARKLSGQCNVSISRIKSDIAKAYGYAHITALESALNATSATPNGINLATVEDYAQQLNLQSTPEAMTASALEPFDADDDENDARDELDIEHYEMAEDGLIGTAQALSHHHQLAHSMALLSDNGFKDVAELLLELAVRSRVLDHVDELV